MSDTPLETIRVQKLEQLVSEASFPSELTEKILLMISQSASALKSGNFSMLDATEKYVQLISALPWNSASDDNLDLAGVREIFDKNHYGMNAIKERIIDYLAVIKLKKQTQVQASEKSIIRAPILCFIGLVGTGKTTLGYSIAEAMGRKIERIPFGGMGSPLDLRGQSRLHADAEPGHIIKALLRAKTNNPVILLDEIDRVAEDARADIMGVLVELLDPEQNSAFTDHYLDYPFNLSNVLFIATANNTRNIATAVMDRLEPIPMPSYSDAEKTTIAKLYIFPRELATCGLTNEQLVIDETVWPQMVRPLGFDAGIRTLDRTINGICRKAARIIVEGKSTQIIVTPQNVKDFLPTD